MQQTNYNPQETQVSPKKNNFYKILSWILFLYCFALPFEEAIASGFGSILRFLGIIIIALCLLLCIHKNINFYQLKILLPFIFWIFLSFVSALWSNSFSWWSYFFMIYLLQIVFVCIVSACHKHIDLKYLYNGFILGALIAALLLMVLPQSISMDQAGRRTLMMFGNEIDPNIISTIIMIGIYSCIDKISRIKQRRWIYILFILFMLVGMLYTGSRGALISFVASFVIFLLILLKKQRQKKRVLLLIFLAGIVALVAVSILPEELLLERFSSENILGLNEYESGSHNRYTIWEHAFPLIKGAPIFGYGCGNFFDIIATVYRQTASHNLYLLLLIENGIVGFGLFIFGLTKLLRLLYKKQMFSLFAMLTAVCIMALTLDTLTTKYFWIVLILVVVTLLQQSERQKHED